MYQDHLSLGGESIHNRQEEVWKLIKIDDDNTLYKISNYGNVYSKRSKKLLKPELSNCGYYRVRLYFPDGSRKYSVHRLVAMMFLENPENKPEVNHKNGIKTCNYLWNLEWATKSENQQHAVDIHLREAKIGDASHFAKYNKSDVIYACELMDDGFHTFQEISCLTGIDTAMLYRIRNRQSWTNVSEFYDVQNCKNVNLKYSENQIRDVFRFLSDGDKSVYQIKDLTGVKISTIRNIISGRYPSHAYLFDEFNINAYKNRSKCCHK